jgi:tRNA dimethylallyltransferase
LGAGSKPLHPRRIALVGATASGKSDVALALAERLGGEIVGADSRQIYRGLEIGTEAPTAADRARVPHHFVAFLDPAERYSAGRYGREARALVRDIELRSKVPIIAGGSGLYIKALLEGLFEGPVRDDAIRARLTARIQEVGLDQVREELRRVDPEALEGILPGDSVRVIRALEVHELTGRPITALRRERAAEPFPALLFGLRWPRPALAERIASRLLRQLRRGFLDETRRLEKAGLPEDAPGPRTLGYRELLLHLRGEYSLEEASERIALKTRQLAKRQETWFRLTPGVHWFELSSDEDLARAAREIQDRLDHAAGRA